MIPYFISKHIEKVINFTVEPDISSLIRNLKERYTILSNNIRISNRIREHVDSENLLTHDFKIIKSKSKSKSKIKQRLFHKSELEYIHLKEGYSGNIISCKTCGMFIVYSSLYNNKFMSCSEYTKIILAGPTKKGEHSWVLKDLPSNKYYCEVCGITAYYQGSWSKEEQISRKWSYSDQSICNWDEEHIPSCNAFKMDEALI